MNITITILPVETFGNNPAAGIHCRDLDSSDLIDSVERALTQGFENIYVYDRVSTSLMAAALATYTNAHEIEITSDTTLSVTYL